jgi:hypothetical protein
MIRRPESGAAAEQLMTQLLRNRLLVLHTLMRCPNLRAPAVLEHLERAIDMLADEIAQRMTPDDWSAWYDMEER